MLYRSESVSRSTPRMESASCWTRLLLATPSAVTTDVCCQTSDHYERFFLIICDTAVTRANSKRRFLDLLQSYAHSINSQSESSITRRCHHQIDSLSTRIKIKYPRFDKTLRCWSCHDKNVSYYLVASHLRQTHLVSPCPCWWDWSLSTTRLSDPAVQWRDQRVLLKRLFNTLDTSRYKKNSRASHVE